MKGLPNTMHTSVNRHVPRLAAAMLLVCLSLPGALAGDPPVAGRQVSITAREQPIAAFLQDLFGQAGERVVVSPNVRGSVNGVFQGEMLSVLDDIGDAFNLVVYYDGNITHVYTAQDLSTRSLSVSPQAAARVTAIVGELDLADAVNRIRTTQGGVLVVDGVPRFIEQVSEIAQLQGSRNTSGGGTPRPSEPAGFRVFYLEHAWAEDVTLSFGGEQVLIPGVASIVRSLISDASYSPAVPPRSLNPAGGGRGVYAMRGLDSVDAPVQGGTRIDTPPSGPDAYYVAGGEARVRADPRLNAIIVRDAQSRLPFYDDLIQSLDRQPQLVEIQATIVDVNTDALRELGVSWRIESGDGDDVISFGEPSGSGRGLSISTVIGDDTTFSANVNALEAEGAANIVSRPQVLTLSNVEAIFDNSETFFVRVAGEREVDLFNISAGTTLRVTPHVYEDDGGRRQIRLLVTIEDGRITGESVDEIPVLRNSSINTQAIISEGESLLLGGLTANTAEERVQRVPLLGDLPVVGRAFRSTVESSARVERLFLITPRLVPLGGDRQSKPADALAGGGPDIAGASAAMARLETAYGASGEAMWVQGGDTPSEPKPDSAAPPSAPDEPEIPPATVAPAGQDTFVPVEE